MTDPLWTYRILVAPPDTPAGETRVAAPPGAAAAEVAEALIELFGAEPDLERVTLEVGGQRVGVCTRAGLAALHDRGTALNRSLDDGDGATLPGPSTGYRILRFRCPNCPAQARVLFVDEVPACPDGHGAMERVP